MTCPAYEPMIELYLDGDLSSAEVEELHRHLEGCAQCRRELSKLRRGLELFKAASRAEPSPGLPADFARRVAGRAFQKRPSRRHPRWSAIAAAALVVLGIGLGWEVSRHFRSEPAAPEVRLDSISLQSPTMGVEIAGDRFELHGRTNQGKASVDLKI